MAKALALVPAILIAASTAMAGAPAPIGYFLAGAQLYSCSADGTNGGPGASGPQYQYSTNSATSHEPLVVEGIGSAIAFTLYQGSNPFSFTTSGLDPGDFACLNVFLDDDGSFNPPYDAANPKPGLLTAIAPIGGSVFRIPAAGIDVQSYNSSGNDVVAASSQGRRSAEVSPGLFLSFSSFTVDPQINGSFTLFAPEPDETPDALEAGAVLVLLVFCRREPGRHARARLASRCDGSSPRC